MDGSTALTDGGLPRPLTGQEQAVIDTVLRVDAAWAEQVRGQLPFAQVCRVWVTGLASVDIGVSAAARGADVLDGPLPVRAVVVGDEGELVGELLVWMAGGFISALEYAWYTDDPPRGLPRPEQIHVSAE